MYQDIEFNGMRGSSLQIYAKEFPDIPAPKKRREGTRIPGRDGILYCDEETYEEATISVTFNYIGKYEKWMERWRMVQKWMAAQNAMLSFSDDPSCFYKIAYVTLGENARKSRRIGEFNVLFTTPDAISYLKEGLQELYVEDVKWNPYGTSKPIYKIEGEGRCELVINGSVMSAEVGQNLIIDTDRMISYRVDGILKSTSVIGDYEKLYLVEGENSIEITKGFALKVIPNWRYI